MSGSSLPAVAPIAPERRWRQRSVHLKPHTIDEQIRAANPSRYSHDCQWMENAVDRGNVANRSTTVPEVGCIQDEHPFNASVASTGPPRSFRFRAIGPCQYLLGRGRKVFEPNISV